jgi:hypothetical protein
MLAGELADFPVTLRPPAGIAAPSLLKPHARLLFAA